MPTKTHSLLAWVIALFTALTAFAAEPETAAQRDARLAWWREARFGMFIHWGPVSLRGTEIGWSRGDQVPATEYDQLYRQFTPTRFDAEAWVQTAKRAGMKYVVLTTKHHDGFCLWDSQYTDYTITHSPLGRDVVKELAAACRKHGLRFCAYHSICDWRHPDYPLGSPGGRSQKPSPNMDRYNAYLKNQLAELLQNYGPLGILWFDGEWESPWTSERARDLNAFLRGLQPSLIINNRIDKGRQDMAGTTAAGDFVGDYDTPEQRVGTFQPDRPWESCITICQQWAWKPDDKMKSLAECLRTLITCAGGDGNLLLNVGPMPTGEIEARQVERLREMGAWLKQNGRAIYGTRGGPFKPGAWGASTHRDNRLFVSLFPGAGDSVNLPPINRRIVSSKTLTGERAKVIQTAHGISVTVPGKERSAVATVIELKLDGPASDIAPVSVR